MTRTAFTHNHQISLSAGTETSKLYVSLGYLDQKVPMKDQDFKRYTANINGEIIPTKWLKVGMGLNATHSIKIMVLYVIQVIQEQKTLMVWLWI